ncbi:methyltransferase regulatory domain-containing protein [Yunchengibacter salinarum]|uniref:methyltransferase regulatory domain-containing protein n=1 Tax=Yunchengibacter salinarum TaxID=3133399 RepID=UPI0035B69A2E
MNDWSGGYMTQTEYTHGVYAMTAPLSIAYSAQNARHRVSPGAPIRYLELGFGQGLGLNVHAAANPGVFWGNDFNPAHVAGARRLQQTSGADLTLLEDSFEDLAERDDLPRFDMIALHGIFSWINAANQHAIVRILRRALRPGGLVYISYNTQPGWAPMVPVRGLMEAHYRLEQPESAPVTEGVAAAADFMDRLARTGMGHFRNAPRLAEQVRALMAKDRSYLAHEFFNRNWHAFHFHDLAEQMSAAKLDFLIGARPGEEQPTFQLPKGGMDLVDSVRDPWLKESVKDFLSGQQFRADLFVRGAEKCSALEQRTALGGWHFVLVREVEAIGKTLTVGRYTVKPNAALYEGLLAFLADDRYRPKPFDDLLAWGERKGLSASGLIRLLNQMRAGGVLMPARGLDEAAPLVARCRALNRAGLDSALPAGRKVNLASPVLGTARSTKAVDGLFLRVLLDGPVRRSDLLDRAVAHAGKLGLRLKSRQGGAAQSPAEMRAALADKLPDFLNKRLALHQALLIAPR